MRYRLLGRTGLKVSEICLGTMTFGSVGKPGRVPGCDERESLSILHSFLAEGGNFIDTADSYADSLSEEILGRGLSGRRHEVVLATKVFFPTGKGSNQKGLSRKHILEALENSLRRLLTDYVDLYQVHCYDSRTPMEETLAALDMLVRQGKVRYLGCSNFAAWQLATALGISKYRGLARFECLQPQYSLVCRSIEREILPLCREEHVGVIPWSPLAGGFLSGKYRAGEPPPELSRLGESDLRTRPWVARFLTEHNFQILAAVESAAAQLGKTPAQTSLAWLLGVPSVTAVIIGVRSVEQLHANLGASGWTVPATIRSKLDEVSALPVEYPQDFQRFVEPIIHGDIADN
jgi:aryl-alcohol dehydrogenase-like predicted oxidoreductase